MAAVIRTILHFRGDRSKSGSQDGSMRNPSIPRGGVKLVTPKTPSMLLDEKEQRRLACETIQRWFRGYRTRILFRRVRNLSQKIAPQAVNRVLHKIITIHEGWTRFLLHACLLAFFIAMTLIQATWAYPGGADVNQSLLNVLNSVDFDPNIQVTRAQQMFDYVDALLPVFDAATNPQTKPLKPPDPDLDAACREIYGSYCFGNTSLPKPIFYGNFTKCLLSQAELSDGYIDNQNRMQFGLFITQQRSKSVICSSRIESKNPLVKMPRHSCVDSSSRVQQYESEICGTPSHPLDRCYDLVEFIYNNITRNFITMVNAGNLGREFGIDYTRCRLDLLRYLGWLDYRTRESCLIFFLFNENGDGRLTAMRDCFTFTAGGKVLRKRDLASSAFLDYNVTVMAITGTFVSLLIVWGLWETSYIVSRHRDQQSIRPDIREVISLTLLGLCLACLIVFFPLYSSAAAYQYTGTGDLGQFFQPDEFWRSMVAFLMRLVDWQNYFTLVAVTMFFFILRTLFVLDFHPTLSIVSGTLRLAAYELVSFFFVYFIVVICYACLGILFFGNNFAQFSDMGAALVALIFLSLGDTSVGSVVFDPAVRIGMFENSSWIAYIWFYSFLVIVSILLLNVLLSIVVGAFVEFQEERREKTQYFDLFTTLFMSLDIWYRQAVGLVQHVLSCCTKRCARRQSTESKGPTPGQHQEDAEFQKLESLDHIDPQQVISSLNEIRRRHQFSPTNGVAVRRELNLLFADPRLCERIISQMRQISIRERFVNEVWGLRALHLRDEEYKSHVFATLELLIRRQSAAARARIERDRLKNRRRSSITSPQGDNENVKSVNNPSASRMDDDRNNIDDNEDDVYDDVQGTISEDL